MNIIAQNRLPLFFVLAVNLQIRITDRIIFLHKFHEKKPGIFVIWNSQAPTDILWVHILIFRKVIMIGLHFQAVFLILFL